MYYGFPFRKEDTESEEKTDQFLIQADHDWTTGKRKECFKTLQTQHADEAAENKARLFHHQVITTDKESTPPPPHAVCDEPVQTKWKATSLHEQLQQQLHVLNAPRGQTLWAHLPSTHMPFHGFSGSTPEQ